MKAIEFLRKKLNTSDEVLLSEIGITHISIWDVVKLMDAYADHKFKNGEIRESEESFCHCTHLDVVIYGSRCNFCGGLIYNPQNDLERT